MKMSAHARARNGAGRRFPDSAHCDKPRPDGHDRDRYRDEFND